MAKSKDSKYRMDDTSDKNTDNAWAWRTSKAYKREKKDWANEIVDEDEVK